MPKFQGTSENGDLGEALRAAIAFAKESLETDYVDWTLLTASGRDGGFVLVSTLTATIDARTVEEARAESGPVRFAIDDGSNAERPFVIELTDPDRIGHARRIVGGEETARVHVRGLIVKAKAPYNPGWSFHLDPATIEFFELAIEVCDASISYVEEHLGEVGGATLPGGHWCPWNSRVVAEVSRS